MAFGIGVNTQEIETGAIKGTQMPIACECWFTCKGNTIPLMLKFEDSNGEIRTVKDIRMNFKEEKYYNGIPSMEHDCTIMIDGHEHLVKLIFFKEESRWVMKI